VIFGFITNRLNVSITGMEASSGTAYIPRWSEIAVTLAIIALGFAIFRYAVHQLPIFGETGGAGFSLNARGGNRVITHAH
jgi:Ni/Fe-hydrogenase subunit HybB-like protein